MQTRAPEPAALLLVALLPGCPSPSVYRTADPTPPGQWAISGGLSGGVMTDRAQKTRFPTGQAELGLRRGVSENVDLGVRAFVPGVDVNATVRFHRSGRWSAALAPQLGAVRTPETGSTTSAFFLFPGLSQLTTFRPSDTWAFTAGPLLGAGVYWPETGGHRQGAWLGAVLNTEARLSRRLWLTPELTFYRVFSGEIPVRGGSLTLGAGLRGAL
ncbi:MAG: hypothetical protein MUF64_19150 [Polyangiaceae bacterium]|nr:hypothetical protein [Polyangiaceae bacterium]